MHRILVAGGAAIAVIASSALVAQTNSAPRTNKDRDQLVCRTEAKTGSRFGRRSCSTRAEREARSDQHKKDAAELMERPVLNPTCAGPGC